MLSLTRILFVIVFISSFVLMIIGAKLNNEKIKKIAYILSVLLLFLMYKMFSEIGVFAN